jgi:spermidine synthase
LALLWCKQDGVTRYEVRSAGNAVRLYTNGVFHSQYNPRQPVTGSVWDLLFLPAFFAPQSPRRVLLLGVGGGAVIRQLNHFLAPEVIVGVELNPVHLAVAQRYFGVAAANVTLYEADALHWVQHHRLPPFDMIIDDLFGDTDGEPRRAVAADGRWFRQLGKLLAPGGTLVFNFGSSRELKASAWFHDARIRARYPEAFKLTASQYENSVGVFLRQAATAGQLRSHLAAIPALDTRRRSCRLDYRIRRLQPA